MFYVLGAMLMAVLAGCAAFAGPGQEVLYRVNCGSDSACAGKDGAVWQPDQEWSEDAGWGAEGGAKAARDLTLPVPDVPARPIYFAERFGVKQYRFGVPAGIYALRLHFAETHATVTGPGLREFHVSVEGRRVLSGFDTYKEAGGFARPCVMEVSGVAVSDGELNVGFEPQTDNAAINGIEVLRTPPTQSRVHKLTDPWSFGPAVVSTARDIAQAGRPVRILFVGHSYTGWWALPETVAFMVNSGQSQVRLIPDSALRGGARLEYFVNETDVLDRVRKGGFDYVVQGTYGGPDATVAFHEAVREGGAKALVYCHWVGRAATPEEQEELTRSQLEVARQAKATFVPVGPAWQIARLKKPDLLLHDPNDGHHPGPAGSYLTACVFYSVLTGRSPVGHPCTATMAGQVALDERTARFLQEAAWEVVERYRSGAAASPDAAP